MKWINKKRNKKGFTLVELVVVIAILGILAAVAVPKLSGSTNKAKWSAHVANVRTIESALSLYEANGGNPDNVSVLSAGKNAENSDEGATFLDDYIKTWPVKPGEYSISAGVITANPVIGPDFDSENPPESFTVITTD